MGTAKSIGIELVTLGIIGLALGLSANAIRAKGSIDLRKNYFYVPPAPANVAEQEPADSGIAGDQQTHAGRHEERVDGKGKGEQDPEENGDDAPDHAFKEIDFAGVSAMLDDPGTYSGLNVFVDARNDHAYEDGHIPGAVQCDPYDVAGYWDNVEPLVMGALNVVVYCGGGDCKDSIYMCRELLNAGVPREAIHLYEGGWKEWVAEGGPAETGRPE